MTREDLKNVFKEAKENGLDVYIAVTIPGQNDFEYIINKNRSLDNKLESSSKASIGLIFNIVPNTADVVETRPPFFK